MEVSMNTVVISYSHTGNNEALAAAVAARLAAKHVRITEPKRRSVVRIVLDVVFNRTPRIHPVPDGVREDDLVLFVAPVWMGHVASPLRECLDQMRAKLGNYAFVSISGGALGPNPKLGEELNRRVGKAPVALIDLHSVDLLLSGTKPTMKDTSAYRLTEEDVRSLTETVVKRLAKAVAS
jgi:multimeric flavodoxin WrbA